MDIRAQLQLNMVADEPSALVAAVRPILRGLVLGVKGDVVAEAGGYGSMKLKMLPRLRRPKDGDVGICFEYAVHDAMRQRNPMVLERVDAALNLCPVRGADLDSILFAVEKSGSEQFIDTARELVTPDSRLLAGTRGQPAKLDRHIEGIARAFRKKDAREALPQSIAGVWKADLFLGATDTDRWVATTVKVNPRRLEGARGLRVGIVPASQGSGDAPYKDDKRNLVVCPLLYDGNFVEIFYLAWETVQQFLAYDAQVPPDVALPRPAMRQVARMLADRRDYPALDVVEALTPLAQPELLDTTDEQAEVVLTRGDATDMQAVLSPEPTGLRGI
ncbi:MAG: hypothetical protein M3423_06820 [Actinomycetota bacterium]|nr:hypothetical protein [Actinomycetota bacterium]